MHKSEYLLDGKMKNIILKLLELILFLCLLNDCWFIFIL